jgi:hypothetical protein
VRCSNLPNSRFGPAIHGMQRSCAPKVTLQCTSDREGRHVGGLVVFLHLLEYRIVPGHEVELTGFLRHVVLTATPRGGLVARLAGRRLSRQGRSQVVATTWQDEASLGRGIDERGVPVELAEKAGLLQDLVTSSYRVTASAGIGRDEGTVLRLHRPSIAAGAAEIWKRRTLETFDRLVSRDGLIAAVAGVEAAHHSVGGESVARVAVVTTWIDWDMLLAAAGGRLDRALLEDDFADLEEPSRASHFELMRPEPGA